MLQNLINQEVSLWTGARFSTFSLQVRCCFPPRLSLFGLQRVVWNYHLNVRSGSSYLQRECCRLVPNVSPDNVTLNGQHATLHYSRPALKKKHLTDSLYPKAVLKTRADWSKQKLSMWGISPALKDSSCAAESHLRLFFFRQLGGLLSGAFTDSPGMWGNWVANTKGVPVVDWSLSVIIFCMW